MTVTQIFTFGFGHKHPVTGQSLGNMFVVIEGETKEHCRCKMLNHFGNTWAFQYDTAERAGVDRFSLTELPTMEFPPTTDMYYMSDAGHVEYRG